jgi:hypothetical protein
MIGNRVFVLGGALALLLLSAAPAVAGDGRTRDERRQDRLDRFDANADGRLDRDERRDARRTRRDERRTRREDRRQEREQRRDGGGSDDAGGRDGGTGRDGGRGDDAAR